LVSAEGVARTHQTWIKGKNVKGILERLLLPALTFTGIIFPIFTIIYIYYIFKGLKLLRP